MHWRLPRDHRSDFDEEFIEEGFVTRYSKGGRYHLKLWHDTNEDNVFDKKNDTWFADFNMGDANSKFFKKLKTANGKKFVKSTRQFQVFFRFPSREFLSSLGEDQDKYIFAKDGNNRSLPFKTSVRWSGYKQVGIEKATFYIWDIDYDYKESFKTATISSQFNANGEKTRKEFIRDLSAYPTMVKTEQIRIPMYDLDFDNYSDSASFANAQAVFTGTPINRPSNAFLSHSEFHLIYYKDGQFSLYLSRLDNGIIADPNDTLLATGRGWNGKNSDWLEKSKKDNNGSALMHLNISIASAITQQQWWDELIANKSMRRIKEIESRSKLKKYDFYQDVIHDKLENNDERLGYFDLQLSTNDEHSSSDPLINENSVIYTFPSDIYSEQRW